MAESARQRKRLSADDFRWYKRDPSRVLAGILGLSEEQKLVYLLVIEMIYEARCALMLDDDVSLAKRIEIDIRKFRRVVVELIKLNRLKSDGRVLWDERAIRELAKAGMVSERQAGRGIKAGRKPRRRTTTAGIYGGTVRDTVLDTVSDTVSRKKTGTANENNAPAIAIREGEGESKSEPTTSSARAARRREALEALARSKQPKGLDETEEAEPTAPADRTARRRKA